MTAPPHYPEGAQIADSGLSAQIDSVGRSLERFSDRQERFNDKQDARFDNMVTRAEFKAEMGRVDTRQDATDKEVQNVKLDVHKGFEDAKKRDESKTAGNRWFTTLMVSVASIASTGLFSFINFVFK